MTQTPLQTPGKNPRQHVLIIVTSNDQLGQMAHPTGLWLEELAAPFNLFEDAGIAVTIASPLGGGPHL